jgi:hypothetical protein
MSRQLCALLLAAAWSFACGCTSTQSSNTARTGKEQILITNAVDQSLSKIDFQPFTGTNVFLDAQYADCVDKGYVIGSIRHRLVTSGARLVETRDAADVVLELRTGAVGTDTSESFVGVPEVTLPGMITLPEVRVLTRSHQSGIAKLGLVAIDARTGAALGTGGQTLAQSQDNNWYLLGMGPMQTGHVRDEVERSTTGSSALMRSPLPTRVVFASPAPVPQFDDPDPGTQYTGGEDAGEAQLEAPDLAEPAAHWYDQ